eukprot:5716809-Pyramimonas_sp.AAC.1
MLPRLIVADVGLPGELLDAGRARQQSLQASGLTKYSPRSATALAAVLARYSRSFLLPMVLLLAATHA